MRIRRHARALRSLALPALLAAMLASVWMAGCASPAAPSQAGNPNEQAAVEATAIIQRAQSTALVLQAQAEARALVSAASVASTPSPASELGVPRSPDVPAPPTRPAPSGAATAGPREGTAAPVSPGPRARSPVPAPPGAITATLPASATGELQDGGAPEAKDAGTVDLLGVEIGTESGLILVQFTAPPRLARTWQQGSVYVVDEATGGVYNEIPVAPIIGPLFARPKAVGQPGYVMFTNSNSTNAGAGLTTGARVTVVLGDFKQEHVIVK